MSVRESRDADAHPNSPAVSVLFDVTGSMGRVPRVLQTKPPEGSGDDLAENIPFPIILDEPAQ